jgi:aerobic carbon-monoxide dehydrogenase large subunit
VDTETGRVTPRRHVAVDDCGRILNPLLVEGQQHGGLAQGIAQALFEEVVFDSDGQPLTATLADYRMPSART